MAGLDCGVFPCCLTGGEGAPVAVAYPLAVVESDIVRVSVLPVLGSELPGRFCGEGRLGCGRFEHWPVVSLRTIRREACRLCWTSKA